MPWIPNVVDDQDIVIGWGNPIRDATVIEFATVAERDLYAPFNTTKLRLCHTADTHTTWKWSPTAWVPYPEPNLLQGGTAGWTDPGTIGNANVNLAPTLVVAAAPYPRVVHIRAHLSIATRTGGTAADYVTVSLLSGAVALQITRLYTLGAAHLSWHRTVAANTAETYSVQLNTAGALTATIIPADARLGTMSCLTMPATPAIP